MTFGIANEIIFAVLLVVGSFIFSILIIYLIQSQSRKKLDPLAAELGGTIIMKILTGPRLELMNYDRPTTVRLTPGGKNSPPHLILEQTSRSPIKLSISIENFATRALGKWGLLKDVKLGDPVFDDKYLVHSDDERQAANYIQTPTRREAIEYFFANGFSMLRADKEKIAVWKPSYRDEDLNAEKIRASLGQLRNLA